MKTYRKKIIKWITAGIVVLVGIIVPLSPAAKALSTGLTVSPMYQKIIVNPGESQDFSFTISNPASASSDVHYELSVEPFYTGEQGDVVYQSEGGAGDIVNWVSFDVPTEGKIEPNNTEEIIFSVDVPKSAPAGGQYFSVMVTQNSDAPSDENAGTSTSSERQTTIKETYKMAHLVYAEITGNTIRSGEISDASLPSFLLSGDITGSASVRNTGNVHEDAKYTLQVFPLFSSEEVYTNEESPDSVTILPNRSVYHETSWENTPGIGIFNVIYTVDFGDSTEQISKMVIICPVWLLSLIIFIVVAIIIWIVMRTKTHKKSRKSAE